jgi:hypothetical protein
VRVETVGAGLQNERREHRLAEPSPAGAVGCGQHGVPVAEQMHCRLPLRGGFGLVSSAWARAGVAAVALLFWR